MAKRTLDGVIDVLWDELKFIWDYEYCCVWVVENKSLRIDRYSGFDPNDISEQSIRFDETSEIIAKLQNNSGLSDDDIRSLKLFNRDITSLLGIPFIMKGSVLGLFVIGSESNSFAEKQVLIDVSQITNAVTGAFAHQVDLETSTEDVKRKILTILNHEFRTPITLVVAYSEMLKDFDPQVMDQAELINFMRGVTSGADRLRRLIENFICVTELETGEAAKTISWRKRSVHDFSFLVEDARSQIDKPELYPRHFIINIPSDLPVIECDVQYISIVIRELLDNAVKFSNDGGTITFSALIRNRELEITVKDEGRGIEKEYLDDIWKPFFQIGRMQYEDQGSGSGLSIVAGIVSLHGGTYHVESIFGQGSTFSFTIPINTKQTI